MDPPRRALLSQRGGIRAAAALLQSLVRRVTREAVENFSMLRKENSWILIVLIIRHVSPMFSTFQERTDGVNLVVQENLSAIRVVKSFVLSAVPRRASLRFLNFSSS